MDQKSKRTKPTQELPPLGLGRNRWKTLKVVTSPRDILSDGWITYSWQTT